MSTVKKIFMTLFIIAVLAFGVQQTGGVAYGASKYLSKPVITETKDASGSITLKWKDDSKATHTKVYRKVSSADKYTLVATVKGNSYKDTSAKINTTYRYYIKSSVKKSGKTVYSANSASVKATKRVPAKITGVKASDENKLNYMLISWKKVSGADGYQVYRSTSKNGTYKKVASVSGTKYQDKSVSNLSTYYYKVRAYNKAGKSTYYGSYSSVIKAATKNGLSKPVITETKDASGSITLKWKDDAKAANTRIYRKVSTADKYTLLATVSGNSYKDTSAKINTSYVYYIKSSVKKSDKTIYSGNSASVKVTKRIPAKVSGIKISDENKLNYMLISWTAVSGADGYQIYRSTSKNGTYKKVASVSGTKYQDKSVSSFSTYYYKVRAYNKADNTSYFGSYSTVIKAVTKKGIEKPEITSLKSSLGSITLKWTQDKRATKSYIYRKALSADKYDLLGTTTGTSYTDKTVSPGGNYLYYVKSGAVVSGTEYNSTSTALVITYNYPVTVTKLTGDTRDIEEQIYLSWTCQPEADGYEIYRSSSKKGKYTKIGSVKDTYAYTDENVKGGSTYYYKVRAFNTSGSEYFYGSFSSVCSVTALSWDVTDATLIPLSGTPGVYSFDKYSNLFDNNVFSEWCVRMPGIAEAIWKYSKPVRPRGYAIVTCNDTATYSSRNPKNWCLFACNATEEPTSDYPGWIPLDTVVNDTVLQGVNTKRYEFEIKDPGQKFQYYMFCILDSKGAIYAQLSEFDLDYYGKEKNTSSENTGTNTDNNSSSQGGGNVVTGLVAIQNGATYNIYVGDTVSFMNTIQPQSYFYTYLFTPTSEDTSAVTTAHETNVSYFDVTGVKPGTVEFKATLMYTDPKIYKTFTFDSTFTVNVVEKGANVQGGSSAGTIPEPDKTCINCKGDGKVVCESCNGVGRYYDNYNNEWRPCVGLHCNNGYEDCPHC